jgi:hypothetical protein
MAINQLLPFATGVGAGVIDQASWAGLPSRLTGFVTGIAEPTQVNKAWRQGLFTSSMIGQFTADNSGFDTLDDGDVATYEAHFTLAIQNVASRGVPLWLQAGGTADALTATVPASFASLNSLNGVIINLTVLTGYNTVNAPTLTITPSGGSAFAAKPIVRRNNTSAKPGEIGGSSTVQMAFDSNLQVFKLLNRHGGNSIVDPGTGALERALPPSNIASPARTFSAVDWGLVLLRSNGGATMADTLPGGGGVMPFGWNCIVRNHNFTGAFGQITISPAGGALIDGSSSPKVLYPGASCAILSDGTNYYTVTESMFPRIVSGTSNGGLTTGMVWRGSNNRGMALCWGAVSMAPSGTYNVFLPLSYESASYAITFGYGGAGAGFQVNFGNQGVGAFDVANMSASAGGNLHWNTWGGVV